MPHLELTDSIPTVLRASAYISVLFEGSNSYTEMEELCPRPIVVLVVAS